MSFDNMPDITNPNQFGGYTPIPTSPSLSMGNTQPTQGMDLLKQLQMIGQGPGQGTTGTFNPTMFQRAFGYTDPTTKVRNGGFAMPALQGAQALASTYLGMKQYGLAKKQFKEDTRRWNANYNMQRKNINRRLRDRQETLVNQNPERYQSVSDYMDKNGV